MKELEDQKISDKFRQVFDEYEDLAADAGWKELRKKYPVSKVRPLYTWIGSAAAALILISGIWVINNNQSKTVQNTSSLIDSQNIAKTEKNTSPQRIESETGNQKSFNKEPNTKSSNLIIAKVKPVINQTPIYAPKPTTDYTKKLTKTNNFFSDSISTTKNSIVNQSKTDKIFPSKPDLLASAPAEDFINGLNNEFKNSELKFSPEEVQESGRKSSKNSSFSLYAGSFFNYAEGSESNVNLSAGFSSDFTISRNLKVSTGLNLSKNTLNFNKNEPSNNYGSFNSSSASATAGIVALSNYQAELLSLDIPVNIKYIFSPEKNNSYFQVGLSSGTYLTEQYGVHSNNFNTLVGTAANQKDEKINKRLKTFDLMRMLNLSIGFDTRLSKKQNITIEPFLKYPLSGLGSENLKFGASGINVKFNISKIKK